MKIYLVDDDDLLRTMVKEFLSGEGYEVIDFNDAYKLIEYALKDKPDLILSDIQMPNMTGDSMISLIEEYEDFKDIPLIVMSGMPENELKILGISKDIPILKKPITLNSLKEEIEKFRV